MNSATSALHIACLALGVGPGDRSGPARTRSSRAPTARATAAPTSTSSTSIRARYNMSRRRRWQEKLAAAERSRRAAEGRDPGALLRASPATCASIRALARALRLPHHRGRLACDRRDAIAASPIGNGRYSDITRVQLPSGQDRHHGRRRHGARPTTPSSRERMRLLRTPRHHARSGRAWRASPTAPWYYEQQLLGFNYRMTDMQAALGLQPAEAARRDVERAARRSPTLRRAARGTCRCSRPRATPIDARRLHLYVVELDRDAHRRTRGEVFERAARRRNRRQRALHTCAPPALLRAPRFQPRRVSGEPSATTTARSSLPLFPALTDAQQDTWSQRSADGRSDEHGSGHCSGAHGHRRACPARCSCRFCGRPDACRIRSSACARVQRARAHRRRDHRRSARRCDRELLRVTPGSTAVAARSRTCFAVLRGRGAVRSATVVRVTADCPLLDPELVELAIGEVLDARGRCDYASNMITADWPYGMAAEVLTRAARCAKRTARRIEAAEREHVTPFIYWRPDRYRLKSLSRAPGPQPTSLDGRHAGGLRSLFAASCESLYPATPGFTIDDVLALLGSIPIGRTSIAHVRKEHRARR